MMTMFARLKVWLQELARVPWMHAAVTLRERFREDRLGLTASSLTFTTTIALVPFFTVVLAVFTAFPMFAKFQDVLQKWLIQSLVPADIARQVLGYLSQFSGKASKLGAAGLAILFGTALAQTFTIDRTLNNIWRVRTQRPWGQRVLVYWAAISLGPLVLGASLSMTSYAVSASQGVVSIMPGDVELLLYLLQYLLVAAVMAALFHYVPNTHVRWGHAWMGGLFVATGLELAKRALALYLSKVPTYSVVYGAFATVPILLVWIYLAWVIVLLGAALTAYLPSLLAGVPRLRNTPGWQFELALEVLRELDAVRGQAAKGYTLSQLAVRLQCDALHLEAVVETLESLDWIAQLSETAAQGKEARFVLLTDPQHTLLQPLLQRLLLTHNEATQRLYENTRLRLISLREAL